MKILLDTNILTRSAQASHPQHKIATSALVTLIQRGDIPCLVFQVVYEFWTVATRPIGAENGLGLTVAETMVHLADFQLAFTLLDDRPESTIRLEWSRLVQQFDVKGKAAHDARLVAAMITYGISAVLTFNQSHFNRYTDINILAPESVA